jgi:uncharacterized protein (DUF58 family)
MNSSKTGEPSIPTRKLQTDWPTFARSKEIRYSLYFQSTVMRLLWRFFTCRLTPGGVWLLILTLLLMAYGSNSLELQAYAPFLYLLALWSVALIVGSRVRPRVTLECRYVDRIGVGETLPLDVEIESKKHRLQRDLNVIPHRLPPGLNAEPEEGVQIDPLPHERKVRIRLGLRCTKRGLQEWKGFRVECDYPFSLVRVWQTFEHSYRVLVTPKFTALARFPIPTGRRYQPGGIALASQLGESFEYIGNREFREGDPIRDIDWRATARLQIPIVREYREEYFLRVGVILDTFVPMKSASALTENFERAISVCAAVSDYMARSDYIVDLFAAGPNLYHLTAGRSLAYLDQILDILACVEENPEEPFETLEPEVVENLAQITTIICVFLDWNETRRHFAERLQKEGAGVKVVIVRDTPCTLDPRDADLPGGILTISKSDFEAGVEEL